MARSDALLALAESVADGSSIDWTAAEEKSGGDDRALVRQLRIIAELATLHRTLPADPTALPSAFAARRTAASPAIGRWAHLDLIERLGGGTFGDVYRAFDRHLEREVALKLLHDDAAPANDVPASRALGEGRLHARLKHPNIVTVYGAAVHDGRFGLWMELVNGSTLEQIIASHGPMSAGEAAVVGVDLCRAVAALHAAGLLHRDIKTQNVMREDGGRIVLMDFGTSRVVDPLKAHPLSDLAGTPLYLAPEIFDAQPATPRSDIYSLGVLLYRLVTRAFPVPAKTLDELQEAHAAGRVVRLRDARPDLPTAFVRVVERAIACNPAERYATAGELEAELLKSREEQVLPVPAPERIEPPTRRWTAWVAVAAVLVAVVGASALALSRFGVSTVPPSATVAPGTIRSLAVLPLANLSGDLDQEYLAEGLTEEIIGVLGRLPGLNVISRTSVMQMKGSAKPLPEIAKILHVDAILEGSVLTVRAGTGSGGPSARRVRVNARLIYAGTDTRIWDRTFETVLDDVFELQRRVANAVSDGIGLKVAPVPAAVVARPNAEARDAYLRGNYLLWNSSHAEDFLKARDYLERAVQLDPSYASASASLARCYTFLDTVYGILPRDEARRLARNATTAAVKADESLPESQFEYAYFSHMYGWDWRAAETAFRKAITLNPNFSLAHAEYARFLMAENRLDEALRHGRIAEQKDPLSAEAAGVVALALYYDRRFDEALAQREKALALDPNSSAQHLGMGRILTEMGQFDRAISELTTAIGLSQGALYIRAELARTYAAAGRRRQAQALMNELIAASGSRGERLAPQYPGYVYASLGDADRAFEWLDRAVDAREPNVLWTGVDPRVDRLRGDPRLQGMLTRLSQPVSDP